MNNNLSSPKAVKEYLEIQRENTTSIIKQNLDIGDIFKCENLQGTTSKQSCLVPYNVTGNHWIFTHIFTHDEEVCLMDPLYNGIHDADWKQVVELALKMFNYQTVGKKRKKKSTWRVIKVPKQLDGNQCGFFVLRYMKEIIESSVSIDDGSSIQSLFTQKSYTEDEINKVRMEWADCIEEFVVYKKEICVANCDGVDI